MEACIWGVLETRCWHVDAEVLAWSSKACCSREDVEAWSSRVPKTRCRYVDVEISGSEALVAHCGRSEMERY